MRTLFLLFLTLASPALAGTTVAINPATYLAALAAAQPGDELDAAPGSYPAARIANRVFAPPVTLRAPEAAVFGRLTLTAVDGFATVGGTFTGDPLYGMVVDHGRNITIDRPLFVAEHAGLSLSFSTAVTITGFECKAMTSDCLDVVSTQGLKVIAGLCHGGDPAPGAHPDCIQLRAPLNTPPLASIDVGHVFCVGRTQCVTRFGDEETASAISVHDIAGDVDMPQFVNLTGPPCVGCSLADIHPQTSRAAAFIANVQPRAASATWTGTVTDVKISARPTPLPQ